VLGLLIVPAVIAILVLATQKEASASEEKPERLTRHRVPVKKTAGGFLDPEILALARKWAEKRGLPLLWVVGTIMLESAGKPTVENDDPDENGDKRSVGLMQINTVAFRPQMKVNNLTREMLFKPEINVAFGTLIMANAYHSAVRALSGKTPPADMGVLTRFMYWGPSLVGKYLKKGKDPRPLNPTLATRWEKMQAFLKTKNLEPKLVA
jgi:hypothetical protein